MLIVVGFDLRWEYLSSRSLMSSSESWLRRDGSCTWFCCWFGMWKMYFGKETAVVVSECKGRYEVIKVRRK